MPRHVKVWLETPLVAVLFVLYFGQVACRAKLVSLTLTLTPTLILTRNSPLRVKSDPDSIANRSNSAPPHGVRTTAAKPPGARLSDSGRLR